MRAKMITDRDDAALAVVEAATVNAEGAAAGLAPFLLDGLPEGESAPDVARLIHLVAGQIARKAQLMIAVKNEYETEQSREMSPRRRRDEAAAALRQTLSGIRKTIEGTYGPGRSAELFRISGAMPSKAGALRVKAKQILDLLADPANFAVTDPQVVEGITLDAATLRAQLEGPTAKLDQAVAGLAHERRETERALRRKNAAVAEFDATFLRGARLLEALFTAAGMPDLAARVRPSRRRTSGPEIEEPAGTPAEPADPGPAVPGPTVN